MIRNRGYNFQNIRDVVDAAECLQNAGKDDDCKKILNDLAQEINNTDVCDKKDS